MPAPVHFQVPLPLGKLTNMTLCGSHSAEKEEAPKRAPSVVNPLLEMQAGQHAAWPSCGTANNDSDRQSVQEDVVQDANVFPLVQNYGCKLLHLPLADEQV